MTVTIYNAAYAATKHGIAKDFLEPTIALDSSVQAFMDNKSFNRNNAMELYDRGMDLIKKTAPTKKSWPAGMQN